MKKIEVKLSKVYKTTEQNEEKLKSYLHARYFNPKKKQIKFPRV